MLQSLTGALQNPALLTILAETERLKPEEMNASTVSPGLPGFIIFFLLCCAVAFLGWDLSRRIRRSTARENVRLRMEALEAEQVEAAERAEEVTKIPQTASAEETAPAEEVKRADGAS